MAVPFAERKRRLLGLALHDGQGLRIEMQIELLAVRVNRIVDLDHAVVELDLLPLGEALLLQHRLDLGLLVGRKFLVGVSCEAGAGDQGQGEEG